MSDLNTITIKFDDVENIDLDVQISRGVKSTYLGQVLAATALAVIGEVESDESREAVKSAFAAYVANAL